VSPGVGDYDYDYDYETTRFDDSPMFDVERLDIEYVDDLALAGDGHEPALMEFDVDKTRHAGTDGHRRRRPHAR